MVIAALALGVSGCGDDDEGDDRDTAEQPAVVDEAPSGPSADSDETGTDLAEIPEAEEPEGPGSGGTQAGQDGPTSHPGFQTPTGNISCAADEAGTRCDIVDYIYEPPPRPKKCKLDWGGSVAVGGEFPGQVSCVGDTIFDADAPVLEYGQTNKVGFIACESSEAGIRCESEVTGHGFFLSQQQVDVF